MARIGKAGKLNPPPHQQFSLDLLNWTLLESFRFRDVIQLTIRRWRRKVELVSKNHEWHMVAAFPEKRSPGCATRGSRWWVCMTRRGSGRTPVLDLVALPRGGKRETARLSPS